MAETTYHKSVLLCTCYRSFSIGPRAEHVLVIFFRELHDWLLIICVDGLSFEDLIILLGPLFRDVTGTGTGILAGSCFQAMGIPVPVPMAGNPRVCPN